MIYHQHQLSKISAQKQTGNVSADFETIVYEYKRLLKLKSMPVQKSEPSEFDKLVAQYKQSGVPKKLQEKEIIQINTSKSMHFWITFTFSILVLIRREILEHNFFKNKSGRQYFWLFLIFPGFLRVRIFGPIQ